MIEYFINEIVESALDNSAGTLLNRDAINLVINSLIKSRDLSKNNIDELIANNEMRSGYMVKYADFNYVLRESIIGDI